MRHFFTYLFLCLCTLALAQTNTYIALNKWKFRELGTEKWYPAEVPGTIHTDLIQNNLIPNPYYESNEKQVQWVEEKDWEYACNFNDDSLLKFNHLDLHFEGLDTYAKVFLNNKQILTGNNMFVEYETDVKKQIRRGNNELKVVFESAVKRGKAEAEKLPYILPENERVFTRKSQYQYGWDWGPRLVTCGIYKNVFLNYWSDVKIISLNYHIKNLSDTLAEVYIISEIESDTAQKINFELSLSSTNHQTKIDSVIALKNGLNQDSFLIKIPNPLLWQCNGAGQVNLINCRFDVVDNSRTLVNSNYTINSKNIRFGLRTIELMKEKDFFGETFYFKVNGKPTFMKGANFIPPDNFMSKKINYEAIIQKAKEANINMLRVWGGGLYLDDGFYTQCDLNGILVWQDFMFACAMYPGDRDFLNSVKLEAEQQVKRLRNHPCLALWCGNNESDEGWHNWGWQKQFKYSKEDSTKIWSDYKKVFHKILPNAVKQYGNGTPYISSSPMIGWGHKESLLRGDSHYWGVWWGNEPFEIYEKKVGRFMSEYGFQGMPSYFTLKKYGDSLNLNSSYIKAHQKHPRGFEIINTYMKRNYNIPNDFFKYVYVSQLLQRDGMQIAIEAHRRAKPYCMGTLFWQFNDCWPVTSWSAIDYENQPKAVYYATKKLYQKFSISVEHKKEHYNIFVVSDSLKDLNCELKIQLKSTKGEVLFSQSKTILVKENSSAIYDSIAETILNKYNKNEIYLSCDLVYNQKSIAHKNYYFVKPKDLKLYEPHIEIKQNGNQLILKSDVLVKDLYLYSEANEAEVSDNYFDLEAGETKKIIIKNDSKNTLKLSYLFLQNNPS